MFYIKSTNGNDFLLKIEFQVTNFPIISLIGFFTFNIKQHDTKYSKNITDLKPTFFMSYSMRQSSAHLQYILDLNSKLNWRINFQCSINILYI